MYYSQIHQQHRVRHVLSTGIASIVGIAGGLIILLLATRFVLSFIQIGEMPSFTATVYNLSYPFVAPISTVFSQLAVQYQTIVAIVGWALVTWLLARLSTFMDSNA